MELRENCRMNQGPVLVSKAANALIPDAAPSEAALQIASVGDLTPIGRSIDQAQFRWTMTLVRKLYGGLWVGGRADLCADRLKFAPNEMNGALTAGPLDWDIDTRDITDVKVRFGLITNIVVIFLGHEAVKLRCFGARDFARHILEAAEAAGARLSKQC
jgi:hypothetical protein